MSAFKAFATLILLGIIGIALLGGTLVDDPGKQAPGPQSPPEPGRLADGPGPLAVALAFAIAVIVGLKARRAGAY